MEVVTPGGETINIVNTRNVPRIHTESITHLIMVELYLRGPARSAKGFATAILANRIAENFDHRCTNTAFNLALKSLIRYKMLNRELLSPRRTALLSLADAQIPLTWFDSHIKPYVSERSEQEEIRVDEVFVEPVLDQNAPDSIRSAFEIITNAIAQRDLEVLDLREKLANALVQNRNLRAELNAISTGQRVQPQQTRQRSEYCLPPLNLRSLGVRNTRMKRLLKHAHDNGFQVKRTHGGDHIQVIPPVVGRDIVVTGVTPSDRRAIDNFYAQLVRSGMPKLENF